MDSATFDCYDRDGNPLTTFEQYEKLSLDSDKQLVGQAVAWVPASLSSMPCLVRTVFLIVDDRRPWDNKPILYETTVYSPDGVTHVVDRYSTEEEAKAGHEKWASWPGLASSL
jgi:hypothetical protein